MYTLGIWVSLLSAAILLAPAAKNAWVDRQKRPQRFLMMWVLGYLALAEPLLNKPPLYTVQMLLPAITVSFGILLSSISTRDPMHFRPSVWFGTLLQGISPALALTALALWQDDPLKWPVIILCLIVALCVVLAHLSIRNAQPFAWLGLLVAAAILFNATALQLMLPNYRNIWSSGRLAEISRAIAPCIPDRVLVGGYVEPSAVFEIGTSAYTTKGPLAGQSAANWLDEKKGRIAFVAKESLPGFHSQVKQVGLATPLRVACTGGFNVGRIEWTDLELFVMASKPELAACPMPAHARCMPDKN
jgi:4-amino-4-deoxy-L-arabinose transferase-like glycosyltransferase